MQEATGLLPVMNSARVAPNATRHVLMLAGEVAPESPEPAAKMVEALVRVRMRRHPEHGVAMEVAIRSQNASVPSFILATAEALFTRCGFVKNSR